MFLRLSSSLQRNRTRVLIVLISCVLIVVALFPNIIVAFEKTSLALFPSAQRAFSYGERHFDAKYPRTYDIKTAEYFFGKAADIDANTPYLYHELARIAFLKGDFEQAMALIDAQIQLMGDAAPNSYYIRALIEGYKGDYAASAKDYEYFLRFHPHNWAALNDYAWVLLKAQRFSAAADVTARGLADFPDNPWLLNSQATALYELQRYEEALAAAQKASIAVAGLSERQWLLAYPGNDPKIAGQGIAVFKKAVNDNMHTIELAIASSTVQ